jgi:hypothetical protein
MLRRAGYLPSLLQSDASATFPPFCNRSSWLFRCRCGQIRLHRGRIWWAHLMVCGGDWEWLACGGGCSWCAVTFARLIPLDDAISRARPPLFPRCTVPSRLARDARFLRTKNLHRGSLKCMVPCARRYESDNQTQAPGNRPGWPLHHLVRATNQPLSSPTQHFLESCIINQTNRLSLPSLCLQILCGQAMVWLGRASSHDGEVRCGADVSR